jgi:tetratricopeptide (TPR) repeat protein
MRRALANIVMTGALLALCLVWTKSTSAAEPTKGSDLRTPAEPAAQPQEMTDAVALFKQRDFKGALKLLNQVVKKNPDLPPAQVIMAQLFSQANIPLEARNALEQAVVDAPADPEAYVIMGDIAMREHRVAEAYLLYQKARSLNVEFDESARRKNLLKMRIFSGLAAIAETHEDWSGAQKQLEAWVKIDPKDAAALQRLARCLFQQKDAEGALEKLKEAAKADAKVLTPEAILAQLYEQADDRENAKKWNAEALKVAPKDLNTRLAVGEWAFGTGQLEEAQTQAAAALQIDPKSLNAEILCGVIALFQKDYTAAEHYFEAAFLQSPRNFAANNNLALVLIEQKDVAKNRRALEHAENNVQQYPKYAEAASTYGWVLYRLGRLDEAEKYLQAAASTGQPSPDTFYYLARLYVDRAREAAAKQCLEIALKNTGPFSMRQEAVAMLEKLKAAAPSEKPKAAAPSEKPKAAAPSEKPKK